MTVIEVTLQEQMPVAVRVYGHSGYSHEGQDIVCSAASVLVQTLHLGLVEVLGRKDIQAQVDEEIPSIYIKWGRLEGEGDRALVTTILMALRETAGSYSGYMKYLEV